MGMRMRMRMRNEVSGVRFLVRCVALLGALQWEFEIMGEVDWF